MTKRIAKCFVYVLAISLIVSCEWESLTDDVEDRGGGGVDGLGAIGTSITCGTKTDNGDGTTWARSELVALGDGSSTVFSGSLCFTPVVPGSLTFSAAGFGFSDDGDGNLIGTAGTEGTISYVSAGWTLDFKSSAIDDQEPIVANYVFGLSTDPASSTATTSGTGTSSGSGTPFIIVF